MVIASSSSLLAFLRAQLDSDYSLSVVLSAFALKFFALRSHSLRTLARAFGACTPNALRVALRFVLNLVSLQYIISPLN